LKHILIEFILWVVMLGLPCGHQTLDSRNSTPKCWNFFTWEALLNFVGILCRCVVNVRY
jgi:hypothetical protein